MDKSSLAATLAATVAGFGRAIEPEVSALAEVAAKLSRHMRLVRLVNRACWWSIGLAGSYLLGHIAWAYRVAVASWVVKWITGLGWWPW